MNIAGVRVGRITRQEDARGSFRELWRASWFDDERFVQANASVSAPGVLRGLHLHRRQTDHWVVSRGRAFVALVDVRPLLAGVGSAIVATLEMRADDWCGIPPGVAHAFLALEELEMLYLVTNEYDGSDELGFAWDDPAVGVPWPASGGPDGRPILSERDRANPTLHELVERLSALL
jgi:dTDP-4-dehydrorhamnose 3,5-epimerase